MVVPRLSLLGLIKANRPESAPRFFQTDLSPSIFGILKIISRSECEWLANLQKRTKYFEQCYTSSWQLVLCYVLQCIYVACWAANVIKSTSARLRRMPSRLNSS